ncbi:CGNR zinc finger domain-containing protein [Crossiella cryophila]|uniref:Putative RNA-binding Zn ribbon-like protein n=1 Tax=Crossiella cryophila TaxID=43355 RepID=A0A7W7FXS9_9PSEU|nr:ABATE domain-containing protein [Crossiella cryophila]MBB4679284.1 putative RNA-binding Zn ribbon-like protein [Crossiella cryophila]
MVDFPLTGEQLALDLLNTRPVLPTGPTDLLATPAGLREWLAIQADRLTVPAEAESVRAVVLAVRELAASGLTALRQGTRPPESVLAGLTELQRAAPVFLALSWDDGVVATPERAGSAQRRVGAELAQAVAELFAGPVESVRECESEDCVLLFLPAHPRRRWCSAQRCGNRARVARYYQRHKG